MAENEVLTRLRVIGHSEYFAAMAKAQSALHRTSAVGNSAGAMFLRMFMGMGSANGAAMSMGALGSSVSVASGALSVLSGVISIGILGLEALTAAGAGAVATVLGLGVKASSVAADFEALQMGLTATMHSAKAARMEWGRLREIARLPGIGMEEAAGGIMGLLGSNMKLDMAERSVKAFGNALVSVGKGKADLQGTLLALGQIQTKGKVSAEEILQLSERVPQIRGVMQAAFGTGDTEQLAKMGVTAEVFISKIVSELEKLPAVAGGTKNAFENIGDSIKLAFGSAGEQINTVLLPILGRVSGALDFLTDSGYFSRLGANLMSVFGAVGASAGGVEATIASILAGIEVLSERMPKFVRLMAEAIEGVFSWLHRGLNNFFTSLMGPFGMLNTVIEDLGRLFGSKTPSRNFDVFKTMGKVWDLTAGVKENPFSAFAGSSGEIEKRSRAMLESFRSYKPAPPAAIEDVMAAMGSPAAPMAQMLGKIEGNTRRTAEHTSMMEELKRFVIGGGERAKLALTPVDMAGARGGSIRIDAGSRALSEALTDMVQRSVSEMRRQGML